MSAKGRILKITACVQYSTIGMPRSERVGVESACCGVISVNTGWNVQNDQSKVNR